MKVATATVVLALGTALPAAHLFDVQQAEAQFGIVVVDESIEQREYRLPAGPALNAGPLTLPPPHASDRHSRAELLLLWTPSDGWITRRRMIAVDGQSAPSASDPGFESLISRGLANVTSATADMHSPAPVLRAASLIPVVDYPIWSLAMLDSSERQRAGFSDAIVSTSTNKIDIEGRDAGTDIHIVLATDDAGRVKRADVTAQTATASDSVTVDYDPAQSFLPRRASERYRSGLHVISTDVVYSHIRRFSASGAPSS